MTLTTDKMAELTALMIRNGGLSATISHLLMAGFFLATWSNPTLLGSSYYACAWLMGYEFLLILLEAFLAAMVDGGKFRKSTACLVGLPFLFWAAFIASKIGSPALLALYVWRLINLILHMHAFISKDAKTGLRLSLEMEPTHQRALPIVRAAFGFLVYLLAMGLGGLINLAAYFVDGDMRSIAAISGCIYFLFLAALIVYEAYRALRIGRGP